MPTPARFALAAALLLAAGCQKKDEAARPAAPGATAGGAGAEGRAAPPAPSTQPTFTVRDLAFATALDAKLARASLHGSDLADALAAGRPDAVKRAAADALPRLDTAIAEARSALGQVAHPLDRPLAEQAVSAAQAFADALRSAAANPTPATAQPVFVARDTFGHSVQTYRRSRASWKLDLPEPQGAEREFAEARREMERTENAFGSRTRVAPREEGHEFDPAAARMTGLMAAERAKKAAAGLPPALQAAASRYAEAEGRAVAAVADLATAAERDRLGISRRYQTAKAEALEALAEYFGALAAR